MAKQKFPRFKTPKGRAVWPSLHKPDTRFNPDGTYKTNLILSADDAAALIEQIEAEVEKVYSETVKELKAKGGKSLAKAKKLQKNFPFEPVYDEDGNETGDVEFKFKLDAKKTSKRTGKTYTFKPKIFDAKLNPMSGVPIYSGSVLKINGEMRPYYVAGSDLCGVTLQIAQVQVVELVSQSSAAPDFEEEDGYEFSEDDVRESESEDGDDEEPPFDTEDDMDDDNPNF